MISWSRIRALLFQDYCVTRRSLEVIFDLYLFSLAGTLALGLFSASLSGTRSGQAGRYILLGLLLWEVVRIAQYSMSVSALWNIWSHNLSNMFVSPLSLGEYIVAQVISATGRSLSALAIMAAVVAGLFGLDLARVGAVTLTVSFVDLSVFAWALGMFLLGLIFCFGNRIQALAWGVIFVFQPLCAVFYPVQVLPQPFRSVAEAIPVTHVFEAARSALNTGSPAWAELGWATGLDAIYFGVGLWAFVMLVRRSQSSGQFARNDL